MRLRILAIRRPHARSNQIVRVLIASSHQESVAGCARLRMALISQTTQYRSSEAKPQYMRLAARHLSTNVVRWAERTTHQSLWLRRFASSLCAVICVCLCLAISLLAVVVVAHVHFTGVDFGFTTQLNVIALTNGAHRH